MKGASMTQIIYKVNLNFRLANKHVKFLIEMGWLRVEPTAKGKPRFFTTLSGKTAVQRLSSIEKDLSELFSRPMPA